MAEIPKPFPEEVREQWRAGIKEAVAKNPTHLEDAVRARVTTGILGPLFELDGLPTYSTEQIAFIDQYARDASRLAVQREQEIVAANPLFQLDIALATIGDKEGRFARESLRKLQRGVKASADKIAASQEGEEMSTEDIAEQILDKDGCFKTDFSSGRKDNLTAILRILGDDEFKKRVDDESEDLIKKSPRRAAFETPTVFDGISIKVDLDGEHGYVWLNLDLVFDREIVKKVIEGPDLSPLPKEWS